MITAGFEYSIAKLHQKIQAFVVVLIVA